MVRSNLPARLALMLLLALACHGARADTAIRLLQSHAGNVNFVGTQQTIRDKGNKQACRVYSPTVNRHATLTGIPATATIVSAQLYWAGSGYNPDFNVIMDGAVVTAPSDRRYYSTTIGNNYNYFSGAADVTAQVKRKRNDTYAFRGLTVDYDSPYCAVEGVLGGFSLLVIYSDPAQPFRMLNLYEGFQYMRYSGITLNLSGFRVPDPIGNATGRVGHITWEGDSTLDGSGEHLKFNNYEMADSRNPSGKQFNSRSNINGDDASYGIDFDAYTVGSPVVNSGQTTASTHYESGQDLVLLSAEVVALPNIPLADLSMAMRLNGDLAQGKSADYTITVSNAGPSDASSPTVVTSTLPAGLTYVSGSGTGWACTSVGQDVTCTSNTALPAGASLPPLTLGVRVTGTGTITTGALVTGKTFDPQTGNNADNVKATVSSTASTYVFTSGACVNGMAFDDRDQTCTKVLPAAKAGVLTPIHITAVAKGVPAGPAADTPVSMRFALSCHNPDTPAGVSASYAGKPLALCQVRGAQPVTWSDSVNITFTPNNPSVAANFVYDDVGLVELFMLADANRSLVESAQFVSVPYEIRFTINKALSQAPLDETSAAFAKAGVAFDLEAGSYTGGTVPKLTPNFGREAIPVAFDVPGMANGAIEDTAAYRDMLDLPKLEVVTPFAKVLGGKAAGQFKWGEAGAAKLTPVLIRAGFYLGAAVTSKAAYGRFIPHHFTTSAKQMECLPNMTCDADPDISTAAYSKEPISVTVSAVADGGAVTRNYRGAYARDIALTAWAGAARDQPMSRLAKGNAAGKAFIDGKALVLPSYELLNAFSHTAPNAAWMAPTSIYLRATESAGSDAVTSKSGDGSFEAGIRIVSGRLLVPNAHGSERLTLPLKVSAQYWTGKNWELSRNDQHSIVDPAKAVFSSFGGLSLGIAPTVPQMLSGGVANFGVKATAAAAGQADLVIDHLEWLPSTMGRLKFGIYKSPLIYMRELH